MKWGKYVKLPIVQEKGAKASQKKRRWVKKFIFEVKFSVTIFKKFLMTFYGSKPFFAFLLDSLLCPIWLIFSIITILTYPPFFQAFFTFFRVAARICYGISNFATLLRLLPRFHKNIKFCYRSSNSATSGHLEDRVSLDETFHKMESFVFSIVCDDFILDIYCSWCTCTCMLEPPTVYWPF